MESAKTITEIREETKENLKSNETLRKKIRDEVRQEVVKDIKEKIKEEFVQEEYKRIKEEELKKLHGEQEVNCFTPIRLGERIYSGLVCVEKGIAEMLREILTKHRKEYERQSMSKNMHAEVEMQASGQTSPYKFSRRS